MEEKRLRAHLIRIFCCTVAIVLFVVLFTLTQLFLKDAAAQNRETFLTLLFAVSDQVRMENAVSHSRLRELEQANHLLFSLKDNGECLLYNSSDDSDKQLLFANIEELAKNDGYDISMLPLTTQRRTSPCYAFSKDGNRYLGAVSILPKGTGYRSITMAQRVSLISTEKIALLASGFFISLALLCIVGIQLIDRALLPAVDSRKRQTQFIAAASHELRSPLAVISANASTIKENPLLAERAGTIIEGECRRMSRLIGDMLLLAAADTKSWPVKLAEIEIDTVLLNVYEMQRPLFLARDCALELILPENALPRVMADSERLTEVLVILLDNALSYGITPEHRIVELTVHQQAKSMILTVADHGKGLTDQQKEQVFERFYRTDAARKEKQHFGLGLSIAREFIALQNGKLTVEDTPGGGCTFRITL